jgi:hypothetical protein
LLDDIDFLPFDPNAVSFSGTTHRCTERRDYPDRSRFQTTLDLLWYVAFQATWVRETLVRRK